MWVSPTCECPLHTWVSPTREFSLHTWVSPTCECPLTHVSKSHTWMPPPHVIKSHTWMSPAHMSNSHMWMSPPHMSNSHTWMPPPRPTSECPHHHMLITVYGSCTWLTCMRTAPHHLPKKVTQKQLVNHIGSSDEPPISWIQLESVKHDCRIVKVFLCLPLTACSLSTMVSKPDCWSVVWGFKAHRSLFLNDNFCHLIRWIQWIF